MYGPIKLAFKYLRYWIVASNGKGHGVHSPFVYDFIENVLNDDHVYYSYLLVEELRGHLSKDQRLLEVEDLGAGSYKQANRQRTIASIVKSAAKPMKYGQLLFRMVDRYGAKQVLEIGTSLGITTAYLAMANPSAQVHTMEGAAAIALEAEQNFRELGIANIRLVKGNFNQTLPNLLGFLPQVDLAFVDGNHKKEPTLQYFHQLLGKVKEGSILVFDDIHWSEGMEAAWDEIKKHEQVMLTVDLFFIGIVFFSSSFKVKQHFTIRF